MRRKRGKSDKYDGEIGRICVFVVPRLCSMASTQLSNCSQTVVVVTKIKRGKMWNQLNLEIQI